MAITNAGRTAAYQGIISEATELVLVSQVGEQEELIGDSVPLSSGTFVIANNELRIDTQFEVEINEEATIIAVQIRGGGNELWQIPTNTISVPPEGGFVTFAPDSLTIYMKIG